MKLTGYEVIKFDDSGGKLYGFGLLARYGYVVLCSQEQWEAFTPQERGEWVVKANDEINRKKDLVL